MVAVRAFERDRDLSAVLELVGRSWARRETGAIFHPGGLQWWLRKLGRPGFDVAVLAEGDALLGFALHDEGDVLVQADAGHAKDQLELLAWVEARARVAAEPKIFVSVAEGDDALREAVVSRGYEPSERYGYELVHDLVADPGPPDLAPGYDLISLTPALADRYVALHRAAWSRPGAPSTYDRQQHDAVTAMPDFRYDLVPIVAARGGALAAYCMSWWDPRSRSVEIEPLGTHIDFRRQGLARAIVREVLRRSWAIGASYVLVWGGTTNPEAKALYLSAGLRSRRILHDYRSPGRVASLRGLRAEGRLGVGGPLPPLLGSATRPAGRLSPELHRRKGRA